VSERLFPFWSAFAIGLSGARSPGPVLTATISEAMKRGFPAGYLLKRAYNSATAGQLITFHQAAM
jgi:threonine/homoserine/homoserine lactone efflux protein